MMGLLLGFFSSLRALSHAALLKGTEQQLQQLLIWEVLPKISINQGGKKYEEVKEAHWWAKTKIRSPTFSAYNII